MKMRIVTLLVFISLISFAQEKSSYKGRLLRFVSKELFDRGAQLAASGNKKEFVAFMKKNKPFVFFLKGGLQVRIVETLPSDSLHGTKLGKSMKTAVKIDFIDDNTFMIYTFVEAVRSVGSE